MKKQCVWYRGAGIVEAFSEKKGKSEVRASKVPLRNCMQFNNSWGFRVRESSSSGIVANGGLDRVSS